MTLGKVPELSKNYVLGGDLQFSLINNSRITSKMETYFFAERTRLYPAILINQSVGGGVGRLSMGRTLEK